MKAILFATQEEAAPFLAGYERGRFRGIEEGDVLQDDQIYVTVIGVGKIKAALRTERFLRQHKPNQLIHVGTCTALSDDLKPGTLFSASQVFEGDRVELSAPTYPRMPLATPFSSLNEGTLVTQDHTVQGATELTYWQRIADASDMTGYAVAYVAATHGVGCSIVKMVAGRAGQDDPNLRKTLATAHDGLADFLLKNAVD